METVIMENQMKKNMEKNMENEMEKLDYFVLGLYLKIGYLVFVFN